MTASPAAGSALIVWIAGVGWDDIPGTDKRLAIALADDGCSILWIDSPRRGVWAGWFSRSSPAVEQVHPRIVRLRTPGPPGFSRWPMRYLTAYLQQRTIRRNLRGRRPTAVVVANPVAKFPRDVAAPRILYMTDDWVAGASLIGYPESVLRASLSFNMKRADGVAGVSPELVQQFAGYGLRDGIPSAVIPNGAPSIDPHPECVRRPVAGLIGQLNERLDLGSLAAVVDRGIRLRIVGPRPDTSPEFARRLDELLERSEVERLGSMTQAELAYQLAEISVGLTPYADTPFNRASFPLKTLEYLAGGVPVVSTDLSASRWIDSPHVVVADTPDLFASAVAAMIERGPSPEDERDRVALADSHGWPRRAAAFQALIASAEASTAV